MVDYKEKYEKYLSKYNYLLELSGGNSFEKTKKEFRLQACREVLENNKTLERRPGKTYMKLSKEMYKKNCSGKPRDRYNAVRGVGGNIAFDSRCGPKALKPKDFMELWMDVSEVKSCARKK